MIQNPYISIIVPVYNVEQYLCKCLDSILAQSFTDWECILVDDGSKDNSEAICDEYVARDKRFTVCHKENGGVSSARNEGVKHASGSWLYFCDADDELSIDALSHLAGLTNNPEMLIIGGYEVFSEEGEFVDCSRKFKEIVRFDTDKTLEILFTRLIGYQGYLWNKLFKKIVVDKYQIRFDESISFNEDRLFITEYVCHSQTWALYSSQTVYRYFKRNNGAMGSLRKGFNYKFLSDFKAFLMMEELIEDAGASTRVISKVEYGVANSYVYITEMMRKYQVNDDSVLLWLDSEISKRQLEPVVFRIKLKRPIHKFKESMKKWFKSRFKDRNKKSMV